MAGWQHRMLLLVSAVLLVDMVQAWHHHGHRHHHERHHATSSLVAASTSASSWEAFTSSEMIKLQEELGMNSTDGSSADDAWFKKEDEHGKTFPSSVLADTDDTSAKDTWICLNISCV
jgi:hypothetical protein